MDIDFEEGAGGDDSWLNFGETDEMVPESMLSLQQPVLDWVDDEQLFMGMEGIVKVAHLPVTLPTADEGKQVPALQPEVPSAVELKVAVVVVTAFAPPVVSVPRTNYVEYVAAAVFKPVVESILGIVESILGAAANRGELVPGHLTTRYRAELAAHKDLVGCSADTVMEYTSRYLKKKKLKAVPHRREGGVSVTKLISR